MVDAELKSSLAERMESVRSRIAEAARRSGRNAEAVRLVAVSKFHPIEELLSAVDCGADILGESRVQEALSKREAFHARTSAIESISKKDKGKRCKRRFLSFLRSK